MLYFKGLSYFTGRDFLVSLSDQCSGLVNNIWSHLIFHIKPLNAVIVEDCKTGVSREYGLDSIPSKFDSNWAHLAEWTLYHKGFLAAVVNSAKLPLNLVLIAHVVVIINCLLWRLEMAGECGKVKKLQLLPHLLNLSLVHHFQ